jgi:hypothetical protein
MQTRDLVDLLAKDASPPRQTASVLLIASCLAIALAGAFFFAAIGPRPDIAEAASHGRFLLKFVVTVTLAASAVQAAYFAARPYHCTLKEMLPLAVGPALLIAAAIFELVALPAQSWEAAMIGHNAEFCLTLIPLLAIGPLLVLVGALKQGAPSSPGLAGAMAGIAAGGIAASFYAAHCTDDSPLFVITWYPISVAIVTLAGYLIGRRALVW